MTKHLLKYIFLFLFLTAAIPLRAEGWWEKMEFLKYTPRYFGANAFPIPEMMGAELGSEWEVEVRGEYHTMPGDKTKDLYARLYIPIV